MMSSDWKNSSFLTVKPPLKELLKLSKKSKFNSVEFENSKADIPEMYADLQKVIDFLIDHAAFNIVISGHTDSSSDRILNLKLSQKRADAIRDYMPQLAQVL